MVPVTKFNRHSTTFEVLNGSWSRYKEYRLYAGVNLRDKVSIFFVNFGRIIVHSVTLPTGISSDYSKIGFAKESFGNSIPEILVKNKMIKTPIITFVQISIFTANIILGKVLQRIVQTYVKTRPAIMIFY